MKENLTIASVISTYSNKKAYDNYCKKILSNKQILAYILKGCVPEYADTALTQLPQYIEAVFERDAITKESIYGKNVEDEAIPGALIKYDLLFEAALPQSKGAVRKKPLLEEQKRFAQDKACLIINLEAQYKDDPGYPLVSRALYYCSRLMAKQKNAADGFQHSRFGDMKKVYSIWICINHSEYKNDVVNKYDVHETCLMKPWNAPKEQYDLMTAIMVYPGKQYDGADASAQNPADRNMKKLLELLNILFISGLPARSKIELLDKKYGIMMTKEIESEVMTMCNLSEGIEERGIMKGLKQGMTQGLQQGIEQGISQGKAEERINTTLQHVKNLMLATNTSAENAMDLLDVEADIRPVIFDALKCS